MRHEKGKEGLLSGKEVENFWYLARSSAEQEADLDYRELWSYHVEAAKLFELWWVKNDPGDGLSDPEVQYYDVIDGYAAMANAFITGSDAEVAMAVEVGKRALPSCPWEEWAKTLTQLWKEEVPTARVASYVQVFDL